MKVTFTRTRLRGYSVTVEGPGIDLAVMDPAPGYDHRLPHDAAHFIVEKELGIAGGIFGQLAAGGTANTFRSEGTKKPVRKKRQGRAMANANREDMLFSEHAVYAARSRWEKREIVPETGIGKRDLDRIISAFEDFAAKWQNLPVGGSISLDWRSLKKPRARRS